MPSIDAELLCICNISGGCSHEVTFDTRYSRRCCCARCTADRSQAGGLGLGRAGCLFNWMRHDRVAAAPAKVEKVKVKKVKKAAMPMK